MLGSMQAHKEDGYRWWVQRLRRMFQLHDEVRIDHFRGFAGKCLSGAPFPPPKLSEWSALETGDVRCGIVAAHDCPCCRLLGSRCKGGDCHERDMEERPGHRAFCCTREGGTAWLPTCIHAYSSGAATQGTILTRLVLIAGAIKEQGTPKGFMHARVVLLTKVLGTLNARLSCRSWGMCPS